MTLQTLPLINNLEFAKKNHEIHGTIESYIFSRLADLIVDGAINCDTNTNKDLLNKISYQLTGKLHQSLGERAQWGLDLILKGQLNLKCQRCLNAMPYDVDLIAQFIVVPNIKSSAQDFEFIGDDLDEGDVEAIPVDEQMQVLNLIEDELLLTLQLAPMHTKEQHAAGLCVALNAIKEVGKLNPFEALKALKK